jgi:CDGSH-type Zn-finger protein
MEDTPKAVAKPLYSPSWDPGQEPSSPHGEVTPESPSPEIPVDEKAHERWFLEQRGNKKVPKRLEIPNEVLVTAAGPLKVTGNITLIEEDGTVTHANHLTLCRCGASKSRPICDDQHMEIEFFDAGTIQKASDTMKMNRPQTLTITCVKDGPLVLRGYSRVYNRKGQEFLSMRTALCRCGQSTKKPFCDCQ